MKACYDKNGFLSGVEKFDERYGLPFGPHLLIERLTIVSESYIPITPRNRINLCDKIEWGKYNGESTKILLG